MTKAETCRVPMLVVAGTPNASWNHPYSPVMRYVRSRFPGTNYKPTGLSITEFWYEISFEYEPGEIIADEGDFMQAAIETYVRKLNL